MEMKTRIITGARTEFYKYGIRTVTMDDLARSMGVSKRTIYENFKDKRELLMAIAKDYMTCHKTKALICIEDADNVIRGLAELFIFSLEMNSAISPLFFRDVKKYYPEVSDYMSCKNDVRDFGVTRLLFEKGLSQGIFRNNIHVELANETLQRLFSIRSEEYTHIPNLTPKDFFRDVFFAYLVGLATEEGRLVIEKEKDRLLDLELPVISNY